MPICRDVFRGDVLAIQVLDRASIVRCSHSEKFAVISITDPQLKHPVVAPNKFCSAILQLSFSDVDERLAKLSIASPYVTPFSTLMAQMIATFVRQEIALGVNLTVVQCDAGMSRSAGVASALSQYYNHDEAFFLAHYRPNRWVRRLVLEALQN